MQSKNILIGMVALALLAIGGFYLYSNRSETESTNGNGAEQVDLVTYSSNELGLSFEYPADYTLETHQDGNAERSWTTLVLVESSVQAEYEQQGAMEGPPSITVQVFENIEELGLEEWITGTSYSNYKLAVEPELLVGEVAGEPARAYEYDGLYRSNAVVVAHGSKIYMFTVGWLTEDDRNLDIFGDLLGSVEFI